MKDVHTYNDLMEAATEFDGECVVAILPFAGSEGGDGFPVVAQSKEELDPVCTVWDYFFTDEPDCFDYERFKIADVPEEFL